MNIYWLVLMLCVLPSTLSSPAADRIADSGVRIARQVRPITTDSAPTDSAPLTTIDTTDGDIKTRPKDTNTGGSHVIAILLGTLAAMIIVVLGLSAITTLAVVWGCKMSRRRRIERELVLRTKHDIFEGVPNLTKSESSSENPFHNVLDSSSPTTVDGGSGTFELAAVPIKGTSEGVATDTQDGSNNGAGN